MIPRRGRREPEGVRSLASASDPGYSPGVNASRPPSVALVTMPFAPATRPSLQLGILKAALAREGIPARCLHPNVEFYRRMRQHRFHGQYTSQVPSMVSEWFFAERPFRPGLVGPDWEATMRLQSYARQTGFPWESMLEIKQRMVPEFLDHAMDEDWSAFDVVGFSMTYPQITASLALARRIKERHPRVRILFGGASSQIHRESASELMRCFPFLDAAVLGEGEPVIAPLVRHLAAGEEPGGLAGVLYRRGDEIVATPPREEAYDLEDPLFPDFQEYFETVAALEPGTRVLMERVLPMEMGRGCAWGDHQTCTFCAFTFHGSFRRRSKERILAEVDHQVRRYGCTSFYLVDNLVTTSMIEDVFPELGRREPRLRIPFMEMRTACTAHHLDLVARAGVQMIQPGIESLDDGQLARMGKGTTVFHNLLFMKGARERGMRLSYNLLLGFPGTTPAELESQYRTLRLVPHLEPGHAAELSLVRFSPYSLDPERYGLRNWRPDDFYRFLYPDGLDVSRVAYEFKAEHDASGLAPLYRATIEYLRQWQRNWQGPQPPYLWFEEGPEGRAVIRDGRLPGQAPVLFELDLVEAALYRPLMARPLNRERLREVLERTAPSTGGERLEAALARFVDEGLVLERGGRFLALALDRAQVEGSREFGQVRP